MGSRKLILYYNALINSAVIIVVSNIYDSKKTIVVKVLGHLISF
jgi:hypothetical protein